MSTLMVLYVYDAFYISKTLKTNAIMSHNPQNPFPPQQNHIDIHIH